MEIFASIKFRDFVVKSSVFIFVSTIFRESLNPQDGIWSFFRVRKDVNTGDMTFQGCKGRRRSDSCIPVISVSIDLPVHFCIQVYQLFMKKIFKHLNLFIYRIFKDVLAIFMTTILSVKLIVVYTLTRKHQNRTQCFECSDDR